MVMIFILITFCQSCFSNTSNDWVCIPGQRVGAITQETTEKDLIVIFSALNIKNFTTEANEFEGTPSETYTYIFPNTKNEIQIQWKQQKIWIISIYKKGCQWKTIEGITIGSSLDKLLNINKKDFYISGYGWEYGGWVTSWNDGRLAKHQGKMDIFFNEGNGSLKGKKFIGDQVKDQC